MSFVNYPKLRETGIGWLGRLPSHWKLVPVKRIFSVVGGSTPKSDVESYWNGDIKWATPADLSRGDGLFIDTTLRTISEAGLDSCGTKLVSKGAIIISTRAPIGSIAISSADMCTNQGCKSLVGSADSDNKYFARLLSVNSEELNVRGRGTTFLELSADDLSAFLVPFPPLEEQRAISDFLDQETSKIDALITEQQRLIELLKEKRQAVISHAVTKGLDPDVRMKPSGVEWLGEVPEHWEVRKLAHAFSVIGSGTTPKSDESAYYEDGSIPWVNTGDLNDDIIVDSSRRVTEAALKAHSSLKIYPKGALVIAMYGATIGKVGILGLSSTVNQACCVFAQSEKLSQKFLFYLFLAIRGHLVSLATGGGQPNISQEILRMLRVASPPLFEQEEVTRKLDLELTQFGELIAQADKVILLLQERRTALISAAVTGKIDVRNYASTKRNAA